MVVVATTKGLIFLEPDSANTVMAVAWRRFCRFDVKELNDGCQVVGFSYLSAAVTVDERLAKRKPLKSAEVSTRFLYTMATDEFFDTVDSYVNDLGIPEEVHQNELPAVVMPNGTRWECVGPLPKGPQPPQPLMPASSPSRSSWTLRMENDQGRMSVDAPPSRHTGSPSRTP